MLKKNIFQNITDFGGISPTKIRQFPFLIERRRPFLDWGYMYAEKENHGDFSLFDSDLYSNSRSIDIQEPTI